MPDSIPPRSLPPVSTAPDDWSQALAALPLAEAPAEGWSRLARGLDAAAPARIAPRQPRWPIRLAMAAGLALVVLVVLVSLSLVSLMRSNAPAPIRTELRPAIATSTPLTPKSPAVRIAPPSGATPDRTPSLAVATRQGPPQRTASTGMPVHRSAASQQLIATQHKRAPRHTVAAARTTPPAIVPALDAALPVAAAPDPLLQLYAESAQLEALVGLARDDRVASASSTVIASGLDRRIGLIDAALSQPDVPPSQRTALWQQRIDALRELAGVEGTERWLAARGQAFDGALVRVD